MNINRAIEAKTDANMPEVWKFLNRVAAMGGIPFDEMHKRFYDGTLSEKPPATWRLRSKMAP
jgi:hypothetical protein